MQSQGQAPGSASRRGSVPALPAEIGFLADHGVPIPVLRRAADLARLNGVHADEILTRLGIVPENVLYRALARELEVPFVARPRLGRGAHYPYSILAGLAPNADGGRFTAAPRGERIARLLASRALRGSPLVITTPGALAEAVFRCRGRTIADKAAYDLPEQIASHSISRGVYPGQLVAAVLLSGILSFCVTLAPGTALPALGILLAAVFLGMVLLRLAPVLHRSSVSPTQAPPRMPDALLPVYTVVVALHREREVVGRLVQALEALDYPRAKLDIKLVVEADDAETRSALEKRLPAHMEVVVVPPGLPRTKPRALNVALQIARGAFMVVYDAEDIPDPGQLRLAVATFARQPSDVACLQARLTIDNTDDTWLTRFFTVEYAALFDVINPGLAAFGLPVPLGGTSNHFRTQVLRRIGGWDAWNVTEDADLGIRLARFGYRTGDLPASTLEEAPLHLRAWLAQRARWMKGFMQTCITHSREPLAMWRELGSGRFWGAVTMILGTVASALGYPIFTAVALVELGRGRGGEGDWLHALWHLASLTVLVFGFIVMVVPAFVALERRRLRRLMPLVPLLPLYYVLVSAAAWRALWELIRHPFRWNKTEHGTAQTSRTGSAIGASQKAPAAADRTLDAAARAASRPHAPSRQRDGRAGACSRNGSSGP